MHKIEWIQNKIFTDEVTITRHAHMWRDLGKKIVFTNGCFDILHHGHLDYLARAADMGNILVVGLNTDASVKRLKGAERPLNNQTDRAFQLAALLCVDAVCLFDEDTPENLIKLVNPDILAKGGDYTEDKIVGAPFVKANGGRVEVIPFVQGYSTSSLIDSIKKL
ncbi:D-glycero-beta-D-manno-heptose 1-phosphate adenylyltransferase [Polluticoccus soli]|uniref:D-glycero-beta-D-manno-heptose 1-phosphate adenylyltransferase n=1 Tax=Polluticoccus soli TaxID=3034150 RepID=UPI0023E26F16|nr:D-glycero-beta-D-manno-heptose 1-phosphate adenylyltransferase [Flavipsychrobacter sp. JY13-12]